MEKQAYIYALTDPRDGGIRYVGKSVQPDKRFKYYLWNNEKRPVQVWVKELLSVGLKPELVILESVAQSEWESRERHWISVMKDKNAPLLNVAIGGKGATGMKHDSIRKDKISVASKRMWEREGARQRHSKIVAGLNNANADHSIHSFWHDVHGEVKCTQFELRNKYNLCASKVSSVVNGKRFNHSGWRLLKNKSVNNPKFDNSVHRWVHTSGEEFVGRKIDLLKLLPELDQTALCRLISGKYKTHKGWTIM